MDSLHFGFAFKEREILFKMSFTCYSRIAELVVAELAIVHQAFDRGTTNAQNRSYSVNGEFRLGCFRHGLDSICLAGFLASSRPSAPGIIDDYLIDDVLAFPGSRRTLILLQE